MTPREFDKLLDRWEGEIERADLRSATVACIIAECNRDTKKRQRPFTPGDFMYSKKKKTDRMTAETMLKTVEEMNKLFGGKDKRRK